MCHRGDVKSKLNGSHPQCGSDSKSERFECDPAGANRARLEMSFAGHPADYTAGDADCPLLAALQKAVCADSMPPRTGDPSMSGQN